MTKYEIILNRLSLKYNKPVPVIKKIVEAEFEFIRKTVSDIDIDKIHTKEDMIDSKTAFNLKGLGKFYLNFNKLNSIRNILNKKNDQVSS